jgi:hypothetical protein
MEGSVVIQEGVAANITLGNGLSTTHEDSRDFSCGGFIVNGSVEMDIDIYGKDFNHRCFQFLCNKSGPEQRRSARVVLI